jgi:hypothetical protein
VAATGLPYPQERHATIMAKFTIACVRKFSSLMKQLETVLGPDTSDLALRVGIHSGPVTAGVYVSTNRLCLVSHLNNGISRSFVRLFLCFSLQGDRARFQLFGDTVNTAARMESTGEPNRVQGSKEYADLLKAAGKSDWVDSRESTVVAKGKGVLETFWISPPSDQSNTHNSKGSLGTHELSISGLHTFASQDKRGRLIDWMSNLMDRHLANIVSHRVAQGGKSVATRDPSDLIYFPPEGKTCLDEVSEYIELPRFQESEPAIAGKGRGSIRPKDLLSGTVRDQVRLFVSKIADSYRDNAFHNFEHCGHVTMVYVHHGTILVRFFVSHTSHQTRSVDKFIKRIVNPDIEIESADAVASSLHDYTHGINSDPVTILAIVMSAMIHDSDHRGISNMQLAKEDEQMAELYKNKSIAEQNSVDISWDILMAPDFAELRACMIGNRKEMMRFRQVLVTVVLATDVRTLLSCVKVHV